MGATRVAKVGSHAAPTAEYSFNQVA